MTKSIMSLEWANDSSRLDFASYTALMDAVGFGEAEDYLPESANPDYLRKHFGPGTHAIFAYDRKELVGLARAFSDDHICSWLSEICVHPQWQRLGIGRELMKRLNMRLSHTALYADSFPSKVEFFVECGIKPKDKLVACATGEGKLPQPEQIVPPAGIRIDSDVANVDWLNVLKVYEETDFGGMSSQTLATSFIGEGVHGFFAYQDDLLVGLARAMSDDITTTWIAELCVHPKWQRKGIGTALLKTVLYHFRHTTIYAETFKPYAGLFASCGIPPRPMLIACSRAPIRGKVAL
jgi:GNAT superfamily N-acetyltransferase